MGARHESMSEGCVKMDLRLERKKFHRDENSLGPFVLCVYEADFDVTQLVEHFTAMMISDQAYVCVCFSLVGGVGLGS